MKTHTSKGGLPFEERCEVSGYPPRDKIFENKLACVGCASHSDFQSKRTSNCVDVMGEIETARIDERDTVLDIGEILESLCKTDLYWYIKGVTEGEDVGKCRGKDCNYCGRYNEKLRQAGEQ
jgi:hypothetical protein